MTSLIPIQLSTPTGPIHRQLFAFGPECRSCSLRNQRSPSPESSGSVRLTAFQAASIVTMSIAIAPTVSKYNA